MTRVPLIDLRGKRSDPRLERLLRRPRIDAGAADTAVGILEAIRRHGEPAVLKYVHRHDGVRLRAPQLAVTDTERRAAVSATSTAFRKAAREAHRRIRRFARAGLKRHWMITSATEGRLGERFVPFDAIGAYIPGGSAPLASTALMTVTLAKVAGVPRIVACTPASHDGSIDPHLLFALHLAGADEIYRVGGIQAIGMMTYGTRRIAPVQKIVGPGGTYVTAAKKAVYGEVALDLVAGPSEIAVIADTSAPPAFVAADLLSQAEHGTGHEKALLITPSMSLAQSVIGELARQATRLSRRPVIEQVMQNGMLCVVVPSVTTAIDLANRFAPEHLELMVRHPRHHLPHITCAGAVFLGPWTPEAAGDFVAGPSHVLPTGGAAASFSGLTVDDFRRRISTIEFSRGVLHGALPVIQAFGAVEGLDGHARSAEIRFETRHPSS